MVYIRTSNRKPWPGFDATFADINMEAIAHSLARIQRFGGHAPGEGYTVSQHCLVASTLALSSGFSADIAFAALLHDAGEAYTGDIPTPWKQYAPELVRLELHALGLIEQKHCGKVNLLNNAVVKAIDADLLEAEAQRFFGMPFVKQSSNAAWSLTGNEFHRITTAAQREKEYLDTYYNLWSKVNEQ
jgi:hypothetical protein